MDRGDILPHFVMKDENGENVDSDLLKGLRYVLFFYSKDGTPGCTKEAQEFSAIYQKFLMRNVTVFGVSADTPGSHSAFRRDNSLREKLLCDPDNAYAETVGAFGEKTLYGKKVIGTIRSTFLIGKDGKVEAAWHNVKATGHAQRVLDAMLSHYREEAPEM